MMAVVDIGLEVKLPREKKGTEPGVGKDKKTGKACYTSGLKMLFFSLYH